MHSDKLIKIFALHISGSDSELTTRWDFLKIIMTKTGMSLVLIDVFINQHSNKL